MNASSISTHATAAAASASHLRSRRSTAITSAARTASRIGWVYRPMNMFHVPVTWSLLSTRLVPSARLPEMNQLFAVSAGIPNHSSGIASRPATSATRIPADDVLRHAQIAYPAVNSQASGRPSEASTSAPNARPGRLLRWASIAARQSATLIGSELEMITRAQ
jgi:hypothetical protein